MSWEGRGERKGARRLPESQRRRVIGRDRRERRGCWFQFDGICLGIEQELIEVHHILDSEDGGLDLDYNLATACKPCHTRHSAQTSQRRSVAKQNDWKRKPERHPGLLD